MVAQFNLPDSPDLVLASDVHIKYGADEREMALVRLINEAKRVRAKVFVLNGDIFDFFFGWGDYFASKHRVLFQALEELASEGCRVYFIEGNHEFGLDHMKTRGVIFLDSYGDAIEAGDGHRILIVHGDLMKNDWKYRLFRGIVRSRFVSVVASLAPQRWLDRFTLWFAGTSRKKDRYRLLQHEKILNCAKMTMQGRGAKHMIFGHFHHPYDEIDASGSRILSVHSWDQPSCLVYKAGKFERIFPLVK